MQSTAQPYFSLMVCAAFSMSAAFLIGISARISASGMLGVRTSAIGSRFAHRALTASSRRSLEPDVATMTGSTTICFAPYCFSLAAIVSMSSAEETIPILTASGVISVNTASSCSARKCGVDSRMSVTPVVFWAVRAVIALMA